MVITELYIKNFGKFSEKRIVISDKMQIFYGENEYGKSTIYNFIKAMLFGLERGRGRAAQNDLFSKMQPWENPNYYAGVMRFECGGRHFYLERQFDKYSKSAKLYCEDDGEELSVEDGDLQILLEGITEESFENTAAVSQLSAQPGLGLAEQLKDYMANYDSTGSGGIHLGKAQEQLKSRKKEIDKEITYQLQQRELKVNQIQSKKQYLEEDSEKLSREYTKKKEEWTKCEKQKKEAVLEKEEKYIPERKSGIFSWITVAGGGLLLLAALLSIFKIQLPMISILIGAFLFVTGCFMQWKQREYQEEIPDAMDDSRKQFLALEKQMDELRWECSNLRGQYQEKQILIKNLQEQLEEVYAEDGELRRLRAKKQAVEMAWEQLGKSAEQMRNEFGSQLNKRASEILEAVTAGKYRKLFVNDKLDITVYSEGKKISIQSLSRGTMEQIYFSVRMAALDLLFEEPMPVIFDDAFVFYDEKRLEETLKWLREQPRQVIIFSCQKREKEMVK